MYNYHHRWDLVDFYNLDIYFLFFYMMHVHAIKGQWSESIYCTVMLFLLLKDVIYTSMIFIWYIITFMRV